MSFRHKSSLSRHNKIHLKVTQCTYCSRSFRYESFLKKHLQTAHKEKHERDCIVKYEDQPTEVIQIDGVTHYTYAQPIALNVDQTYSS